MDRPNSSSPRVSSTGHPAAIFHRINFLRCCLRLPPQHSPPPLPQIKPPQTVPPPPPTPPLPRPIINRPPPRRMIKNHRIPRRHLRKFPPPVNVVPFNRRVRIDPPIITRKPVAIQP